MTTTEMDDKRIKRLRALPIIFGASIFLITNLFFWVSLWVERNRVPKGGFSGFIVGTIVEGAFQIIPFVMIAKIIADLCKRTANTTEIYSNLGIMLLPVCIFTPYWLLTHIDPFARGLTLFINFALILIGRLIVSTFMITRRS